MDCSYGFYVFLVLKSDTSFFWQNAWKTYTASTHHHQLWKFDGYRKSYSWYAQGRYVFADACILVSLFLRRDIQMINTS